jgi:glycerate kinase
VIECAAASGLLRVQPAQRDALRATSRGTGDLIAAALDAGHDHFLIGLGGSATTDGGAGMAQALGFRLLDAAGLEIGPGGAALIGLARIDVSDVDPRLARAVFRAATDVTNPLCGPDGAAAVYGPQKGADPEAVTILDRALEHLAAVIARDLGVDIRDVAGAGAAGGLGAGVIAFLGGELLPGAALVGAAARIEERVRAADAVLTGEGRLDRQTAFGKAPGYVAAVARRLGRPVACVAGSRGDGFEESSNSFDIVEVASRAGVTSQGRPQDEVGAAAVQAVRRLMEAGLLR